MNKISKSPDRNTFQKENYVKRQEEAGKLDEPDTKYMMDFYESWNAEAFRKEQDPEWQKDNMEWDLRVTDWILEKVRASDVYAQNLYAAICNNDFQKLEVIPILTNKTWSASWRSAGGIVANMRQEGDYIDWYCSGIRNDDGYDPELNIAYPNGYVPEMVVTDEIRTDLQRLGWIVVDQNNEF
jgi:hypothetical protein